MKTGHDLPCNTTDDKPPCRLLNLPPELRSMVYRHALHHSNHIDPNPHSIRAHKYLLDACTEIRSEASAIFWAENEFNITAAHLNINQAREVLDMAGRKICESITHLCPLPILRLSERYRQAAKSLGRQLGVSQRDRRQSCIHAKQLRRAS